VSAKKTHEIFVDLFFLTKPKFRFDKYGINLEVYYPILSMNIIRGLNNKNIIEIILIIFLELKSL